MTRWMVEAALQRDGRRPQRPRGVSRQERKRQALLSALVGARAKLAGTRREDYAREADFRRVLTLRRHVVARLRKRLRALSPASL